MSNYFAEAINPRTAKIEMAEFLDNYYDRRKYGVRFPDGKIYPAEDVKLPKGDGGS